MADLGRYNGVAFAIRPADGVVLIAPNASVRVMYQDTGALAAIFSDRDGLVSKSNPITADAYGRFNFCAAGRTDGFRIRITEAASPGLEVELQNVAIGTFGELDTSFTSPGDLLIGGASGAPVVKPIGSDGYRLTPCSTASDGAVWAPPEAGSNLVGGYLDWSTVGSPTSTLTVSIKTWAGNNPSASEPVFIPFRSVTPGTGTITYRKITAATSIVINSSALMGTSSNVAFRLWCVAFDDGGTIRLALINCVSSSDGSGAGRTVTAIYPLCQFGIASSTQESDTADSAQIFYSDGAAAASKAYSVLGYATWESGLANAGNWNSNPTRIQLFGPGVPLPGQTIQVQRTQTGAYASGTTQLPMDDTIPQIAEGDQYMTQAITPGSAANVLGVDAMWIGTPGVSAQFAAALFQDATANALAAVAQVGVDENYICLLILHSLLALTSSATTFRIRAGANGVGTTEFNGRSGGRQLGGVFDSYLHVEEVMG